MAGFMMILTTGCINRGLLRMFFSPPFLSLSPFAFFFSVNTWTLWTGDLLMIGYTYSTEEAYTKAVTTLFKSLDRVEEELAKSSTPYLLSSPHVTEADVRLYTTAVRFDPVYVQHFKCNIRDVRSGYPHIHKWMRHLYWVSFFFSLLSSSLSFSFFLLSLFFKKKTDVGSAKRILLTRFVKRTTLRSRIRRTSNTSRSTIPRVMGRLIGSRLRLLGRCRIFWRRRMRYRVSRLR